ncbi:BTAD domain-containing putative transcriptional regulator [Actinoplanes sp. NPDC049599]|uniref:AfsR/SARP family transcriptional regulator n=1 Tax=Actinoplanes sp. NPDC049599 TaxID=3363903 RepID=UPI003795E3DC
MEVLGPLRAWRGDQPTSLGPVQQRVVLAILALHANRSLGREQLIEAVWGEEPPAYAVNLVQKNVSALRRSLEPVRPPDGKSRVLTWSDAGYRLILPEGGLDLADFDRELARSGAARATGDLPAASRALHTALGLWRGPLLDGLAGPLLDAERERLAERRIGALEDRIEVDLCLGDDRDLVAELRRLVAEHPLRERLRGLLMQALYRSGQRADALAAFRETHDYLYAELGVGPGAELQELHRRLLDDDPELTTPRPVAAVPLPPAVPVHRPPTPAQLPHGMADFTGRQRQLARLDELLDREDATAIAMIIGTAGVGKTSLAVHWAHRVSDRFPDGQLYVNLRGFDAHGSAVEPGDALRGFFDAFAVPNAQVPARLEDQAALYRSLLAGRRILVVLDNARDSEQIGPLLPGAPGCAVVVTSRRRLAGVAAAGADVLSLDLLAPGEAREFFSGRVGAARVAAEPVAFDAIVADCARLPLALAIVAARAAVYPEQSLTALATDLREAAGGLDAFVGENPANDARAVLSWSYARLGPAAARLFRLLGLHRRPDIATPAAASLAGVPVAEARRLLRELTSAHLVEEATPGRFGFHDLLRAYAREQTLAVDSDAERRHAVLRLLDHYLHTAWLADRTLYPYRQPIGVEPADPATVVARVDGPAEALVWFLGEQAALLAAVEQAEAEDFPRHASRLAWTITAFLNYQGKWHDWAGVLRIALSASRQVGDVAGQALTHRLLSLAYLQQGLLTDAEAQAKQAFDLFGELGDRAGQARLHLDYSRVLERQGDIAAGLERAELALELFRAAGEPSGEADALNWVGWFHSLRGFHQQALDYCHQSLDLHRRLGDSPSQADTWDALGFAHHHLGNSDAAMSCYEKALGLWRELGDRYEVATTTLRMGNVQHSTGDLQAARKLWLQARIILDELGHPLGEQLSAWLAEPTPSAPPEGIHHV